MSLNETLKKGIEEFTKGNFLNSEKIFTNLIRRNPLFLPAYSNLIQLLINQGNLDEAMKYSEKLLNIDKNTEKALFYKGIIKFKKSEFDKALSDFKNALIINPKNHIVLMNIGISYYRLGDNLEAIKYIKESIQINNKNELAFYNLAVIYEDEDELDLALDAYDSVISLNPKHHDSIHGIAQIQLTNLDYINGFKNYEIRWNIKGFEFRHNSIKKLSSINDLSGKKY